jgi:multicomponent Na+:H+ antiporter subunit C
MTVQFLPGHYPYILIAILLVIGLYGMTMKKNLLKKIIGMTIFQTSQFGTDPDRYMNPLPQVIVLTAIVVGVAITGVALSLLLLTQKRYGTINEDEILQRMRQSE